MSKKVVPAIAIVFNKKNQILLVQRNYVNDPASRYHGAWGFPGGGIEENEQPMDATIRETLEETGIRIKVISDRPIVMSCVEQTGNHVIKLAYLARYISGEVNTNNDTGTSDAKWFFLEDIEKLDTTPLAIEIARKASKLLKTEFN